ncbi:hypothetical protein SCALM49S_06005 [Streptomyces californicus]
MPSWQLTVRPDSGRKRWCTPAEWLPRLGRTAGARVQERTGSERAAQRANSPRAGPHSQGLALTNWCSDVEAASEPVTTAAMRRTVFLPCVRSSPCKYTWPQRCWSERCKWPNRSRGRSPSGRLAVKSVSCIVVTAGPSQVSVAQQTNKHRECSLYF